MRFFDWLIDNLLDRRGHRESVREMDEAFAEFDRNVAFFRALEARARELYTPEEWASVEARCEAILSEAAGRGRA